MSSAGAISGLPIDDARRGTTPQVTFARERRYQDIRHSKTDFMDRLNHRLKPGNLISSRTKLALRLGALGLVLAGAALNNGDGSA